MPGATAIASTRPERHTATTAADHARPAPRSTPTIGRPSRSGNRASGDALPIVDGQEHRSIHRRLGRLSRNALEGSPRAEYPRVAAPRSSRSTAAVSGKSPRERVDAKNLAPMRSTDRPAPVATRPTCYRGSSRASTRTGHHDPGSAGASVPVRIAFNGEFRFALRRPDGIP